MKVKVFLTNGTAPTVEVPSQGALDQLLARGPALQWLGFTATDPDQGDVWFNRDHVVGFETIR